MFAWYYWILIVLAVIIVVPVLIAMTRPDDFRYIRTGRINAPPAVVFEYANDVHKWQEWSPWAREDPNCKYTFTGPPAGRDASFKWAGNSKVGEGGMTVTESRPVEFVQYRLEFFKPFKCTHTVEFIVKPDGANATLDWVMYGKHPFIGKVMGVFMNVDKMLGERFEEGFKNLNEVLSRKA